MLKQLIQRLLDSRTTPSEAAHNAMPQEDQVISYGSTTENPGSWTTILSFTAPKDGYAKAVVVGTGKNSAELYCGNMRVSAFAPVDNASINVVMPVRNLPLPVGTATFIEYVKALMSRSQSQLLYRTDGLCFFRLINSAVGGASC